MAQVVIKKNFFDGVRYYWKDVAPQFVPDHIAEDMEPEVGDVVELNSEAPEEKKKPMGEGLYLKEFDADRHDPSGQLQFTSHARKFIAKNGITDEMLGAVDLVGTGAGGGVTLSDIRKVAEANEWLKS